MGVDEDHLAMPRVSAFNAAVQNAGQESSWGLQKLMGEGRASKGATSWILWILYDLWSLIYGAFRVPGVRFTGTQFQVQLDSG